eukprot:2074384-Alexandrium_andersonii.AAC.1
MPHVGEQQGVPGMVAALSEAGQERAQRGLTPRDEVRALVKQRSRDTTVTRMARQSADASLASVARAQAA